MTQDITPTPVAGWLSYGRNLRKRQFELRLYLTHNPDIDRDIQAGYWAEDERLAAKPAKPKAVPVDLFGLPSAKRR